MFKRMLFSALLAMICGWVMLGGIAAETRGSTCGTVTFEYGNPGDLRWIEVITVDVYDGSDSYLFTNVVETDEYGNWCLENQISGSSYIVRARANDTLYGKATNVSAFDLIEIGTLVEGNVDDSHVIDAIDHASVVDSYGRSGLQQDDLDEDGFVGVSDMSLLRKNFGRSDDSGEPPNP